MNNKHRSLIIVAMVCIVLIMGMYGTGSLQSPFSFGGFPSFWGGTVNPTPFPSLTASPSPTFYDSGGYIPTPTDTPTPTPEDDTSPRPDPSGQDQQDFLWLDMNPNPATMRDEVLGEVYSNLVEIEAIVHWIDGVEYMQTLTLNNVGYGSFIVQYKTGTYHYWVTYGVLTSNEIDLVVT